MEIQEQRQGDGFDGLARGVGDVLDKAEKVIEDATKLFETQAYQPHPVAVQEAKRGTSDALYGYYTLGKLMIMKLRSDWTATRGGRSAWKDFHDKFLSYGAPPVPLVRRAMLGAGTGSLF